MKRLIGTALALIGLFSLAVPAFAADKYVPVIPDFLRVSGEGVTITAPYDTSSPAAQSFFTDFYKGPYLILLYQGTHTNYYPTTGTNKKFVGEDKNWYIYFVKPAARNFKKNFEFTYYDPDVYKNYAHPMQVSITGANSMSALSYRYDYENKKFKAGTAYQTVGQLDFSYVIGSAGLSGPVATYPYFERLAGEKFIVQSYVYNGAPCHYDWWIGKKNISNDFQKPDGDNSSSSSENSSSSESSSSGSSSGGSGTVSPGKDAYDKFKELLGNHEYIITETSNGWQVNFQKPGTSVEHVYSFGGYDKITCDHIYLIGKDGGITQGGNVGKDTVVSVWPEDKVVSVSPGITRPTVNAPGQDVQGPHGNIHIGGGSGGGTTVTDGGGSSSGGGGSGPGGSSSGGGGSGPGDSSSGGGGSGPGGSSSGGGGTGGDSPSGGGDNPSGGSGSSSGAGDGADEPGTGSGGSPLPDLENPGGDGPKNGFHLFDPFNYDNFTPPSYNNPYTDYDPLEGYSPPAGLPDIEMPSGVDGPGNGLFKPPSGSAGSGGGLFNPPSGSGGSGFKPPAGVDRPWYPFR